MIQYVRFGRVKLEFYTISLQNLILNNNSSNNNDDLIILTIKSPISKLIVVLFFFFWGGVWFDILVWRSHLESTKRKKRWKNLKGKRHQTIAISHFQHLSTTAKLLPKRSFLGGSCSSLRYVSIYRNHPTLMSCCFIPAYIYMSHIYLPNWVLKSNHKS